MKKVILSMAVTAITFANVNAANHESGKEKSAACVACHSTDGNSVIPTFPKISGQNIAYLTKQLNEFKDHTRNDATMEPVASGLSEKDIKDLALFYSTQKRTIGKADPALAKLGGKLYKGGNMKKGISACIACHGPKGSGLPSAAYPKISGQHAAYTEKQLNNFKTGFRHNDPSHDMMQDIAKRMSDIEIKALASYLEGLH